MRSFRGLAVAVLLSCLPVVLVAGVSGGVGSFFKQIPGTDRRVPITDATLADKVIFQILIVTQDGEYPLQINVYDGSGREVYNAESTVVAKDGRAGALVSYGFNPGRDAPGTWWYVAALDGRVVASNSLKVSQ